MQKQLEKRILEAEKMKQQEREERRKAMDAVEKQVSRAMRWNYVKCPVRYLSQSQCKEIKIQVEVDVSKYSLKIQLVRVSTS